MMKSDSFKTKSYPCKTAFNHIELPNSQRQLFLKNQRKDNFDTLLYIPYKSFSGYVIRHCNVCTFQYR